MLPLTALKITGDIRWKGGYTHTLNANLNAEIAACNFQHQQTVTANRWWDYLYEKHIWSTYAASSSGDFIASLLTIALSLFKFTANTNICHCKQWLCYDSTVSIDVDMCVAADTKTNQMSHGLWTSPTECATV